MCVSIVFKIFENAIGNVKRERESKQIEYFDLSCFFLRLLSCGGIMVWSSALWPGHLSKKDFFAGSHV